MPPFSVPKHCPSALASGATVPCVLITRLRAPIHTFYRVPITPPRPAPIDNGLTEGSIAYNIPRPLTHGTRISAMPSSGNECGATAFWYSLLHPI
jgi:hypothetical protein